VPEILGDSPRTAIKRLGDLLPQKRGEKISWELKRGFYPKEFGRPKFSQKPFWRAKRNAAPKPLIRADFC